ncbi:hypothetical protein ACQPU1_00960 [Clostridium paraputrificum]|uniref:hypothetical protein n=1 Tax=Clostridium paraputrificum TaxID=29363 RepID=UPI003D351D9E
MLNMLFILMVVVLVSICSYRILYNNILRNNLGVKYSDLYSIDRDTEEILSEVNLYVNNKTIDIEKILISNEATVIKSNVVLIYDKEIDRFILIDSRGLRKEISLRYEKRNNKWFLLPTGRRYVV